MDSCGLARCFTGQQHADGAHDPTPAADDHRAASDLARRAGDHNALGRMANPETYRQTARTPRVLLAECRSSVDRMACAGDIRAGHAVPDVAFHRARLLLHDRPPLLVAGNSALAVGRTMA